MAKIDCKNFSGYKPCGLSENCDDHCAFYQKTQLNILIVQLGALGAVLRATCILKPIRRKFPMAKIHWITDAPADKLLQSNPLIDLVSVSTPQNLLSLNQREFDVVFCLDKCHRAIGIAKQFKSDLYYGFASTVNGTIVPANQEARELWDIGLSNQKKFFENKKPESQLITEALGLDYVRDRYDLFLSPAELELADRRRNSWSEGNDAPVIGINTGCADVIPYKKFTIEKHTELVKAIEQSFGIRSVLLGGPEDQLRNHKIAENCNAILSPSTKGIRDGISSMAACDLVVTGDSLGMHMSIALNKYTIAWFGPTCSHEIDLFENGVKLEAKVACSPCWKRKCDNEQMCYDKVSVKSILQEIAIFLKTRKSHIFLDSHLESNLGI